jgi:lycopene beta-cyclase
LNEDLVERFYAARSTFPDKTRILIGKPPVPVSKAIAALITPGRPLAAPQETPE